MSNSRKTPPFSYTSLFEKDSTPREKTILLNRGESRFTSWYISEREFAPVLEKLRNEPPAPRPEEGLLNESSGKFVWKIEYESNEGRKCAAYKTNPGKTPWRYIFNSSLPIREMRNYWLFEELGIPVARVLAAGDIRTTFILKETFIVTEFLENTFDGRVFMPGGSHRNELEKRKKFCRLNLELLAKLHKGGIFHKAFHPRNLLWRDGNKDMEIFWIDVARCRKVSPGKMPFSIIKDLHTFFRDLRLTREETLELIAHYLSFAPKGFLPESREEILERLIRFRRHLFKKKYYKLFSEND